MTTLPAGLLDMGPPSDLLDKTRAGKVSRVRQSWFSLRRQLFLLARASEKRGLNLKSGAERYPGHGSSFAHRY